MNQLAYHTPGVYQTTPTALPSVVTLVRTDIAGFVGFAERGPLPEDFGLGFDARSVAQRLTSWAEFQTVFGSFLSNGYLAYAVQGFFATGGATCYVVRVAATQPSVAVDRQARAASFALPLGAALAIGTLASGGGGYVVKVTLTPPTVPTALVGTRIVITHQGLSLGYMVQALLPDGSFLLSAPLDPTFVAGDTVRQYPTAVVVTARSRGSWGNNIQLQFTALDNNAFALVVSLYAGPDTLPAQQEFYSRLVLDPTQPNDAVTTLAAQSNLITLTGAGKSISFDAAGPLGGHVIYLAGGRDGLVDVSLGDFTGTTTDRRGLRLLEEIDEVSMIAIPDAMLTIVPPLVGPKPVIDPCSPPPVVPPPKLPPDSTGVPAVLSSGDRITLQMTMIEQCERLHFRVALLDPPAGLQIDTMTAWPLQNGLINQSAAFAALYYPWLVVPASGAGSSGTRVIPPSGYVAGTYADVDLTGGVQNPPANVELAGVLDVATDMTNLQQGPLNDAYVNVIRSFPGRGIRVWGARSLAADESWRYIHIRRLISAIENTALRTSRWAVFETNNTALRNALSHSLNVLLESIWATGGLLGSTPDQGFYVKCDDTNNPQSVIDAGQVICQIGVAVAAPMEFLVFQIRQDVTGGTVTEN
jgi:hypothetical protein